MYKSNKMLSLNAPITCEDIVDYIDSIIHKLIQKRGKACACTNYLGLL